jgi:uncharacterized membrane protein
LVIALDASKSMTVADEVDNKSRWQTLQRVLQRSEPALEKLRTQHGVTVKMHRFAEDVTDPFDEPPTGNRTDFGQMLRTLAERYGQERALRGLVVLSDGADNGVRFPALGEAARYKVFNCPVYAFGLGRDNTSSQQRDLAVMSAVADPSPVAVKGRVSVKTTIDAPGYENACTTLRLLFDGKEVAAKEIVLPKSSGNEVAIEANAPISPGEIKLTVKVDALPGEASTANNELTTYLTVSKEGLSVLVIDRLRLELKFIRRALSGDPRIRLFEAVRQTDEAPRGAETNIYDLDRQAYDVIVIGDVSARRLAAGNPRILQKIEELVRDKGVGLLMIGGAESFGAGGWRNTPLANLMPVQMDAVGQSDESVRMQPAPQARNEYMMRIGPDPAASDALWKKLPALPGYTRFGRRKDGAVVVGESAAGAPLLVRQNYGKGRTAALALDMTYLWQQLGQNQRPRTNEGVDLHARFWRQLMLFLAQQEEIEGSVWIKPDMRRVPVGGKVPFGVGVRGKTGLDLPEGKFDTQAVGPDGPLAEPVTTAREKDADRGSFWKTEKSGEYKLIVKGTAKDADGNTVSGEATARFLVFQDDTELLRPAADHEFLARLASAGGGQAFFADDLPKFLEELPGVPLAAAGSKVRYLPDWRSARLGLFPPALFIVFVSLLGLEWGLRRWWGMV